MQGIPSLDITLGVSSTIVCKDINELFAEYQEPPILEDVRSVLTPSPLNTIYDYIQ